MFYKVVMIPNKALKTVASLVEEDEFGENLERVMSNMAQTMYGNNGVGLAGNQVGLLKRVLVADIGEKYGTDLAKMVNPVIVESSEETAEMEEGCLSLPGFFINVKRPLWVSVEYRDPQGGHHKENFVGAQAHVVQHEIDHLEAITLLDQSSYHKKRYLKKLKKLAKKYPDAAAIMERLRQ